MRCPCCNAPGATPLGFLAGLHAQLWKCIGLLAAVSSAVIGQAELVGEPWRHYLTITAIGCTAAIAWRIKAHPLKEEPV